MVFFGTFLKNECSVGFSEKKPSLLEKVFFYHDMFSVIFLEKLETLVVSMLQFSSKNVFTICSGSVFFIGKVTENDNLKVKKKSFSFFKSD